MAALTLLSLAFTILLTMFDLYGWKNWSLENFLLLRSFQISNSFLVWNVEDQVNSSIVIDAKYGTNITATTLTLGVTCTIMNLSGILQDFVIQDLTLLVALTLYYKTHEILDAFRKSDESKNMYYANLGENWNQCTALKGLSDSANEAFGVSLKLMHIKYLFTVTFVLLKWLKGDGIRIYDTIVALNICRIIFFYWIALKTSENVKISSLIIQQFFTTDSHFYFCNVLSFVIREKLVGAGLRKNPGYMRIFVYTMKW